MFNITILVVGTLKEQYLRDAYSEYAKRLKPYAKIELIELSEVAFHSVSEKDAVIAKEAETILKKIPQNSSVFLLSQEGTQYSSEEFAQLLSSHSSGARGLTHCTFVIGGSLGLDASIKKSFKNMISFSRMTFTHQMARVILIEQIYRAATILAKKQYHY